MKLKISLFITSFLPLWISIVFINTWSVFSYVYMKTKGKLKIDYFNTDNFIMIFFDKFIEITFSVVLLILFCISAWILYSFLKENTKSRNNPLGEIKRVTRAHNLGSDFLLAYILPMITFNFSSLKDVILFTIIFIILGLLCIRNENIYTNMFLELILGYQMFYVDLKKDAFEEVGIVKENVLFLSKNDLRLEINRKINYYEMTNFIYINLNGGYNND